MVKQERNSRKSSIEANLSSFKWGYLPLSIFNNSSLSSFEIIVKFLKEEMHFNYREVSEITGRHISTISCTYLRSAKKQKKRLEIYGRESIPLTIFLDKRYSVLESLVIYLHDVKSMSVNQISEILEKNNQTIYTILRRARKKNEKQEQ